MPTLHASTAWLKRKSYREQVRADLQEYARLRAEPFTPDAMTEKLRPVEARIRQAFDSARQHMASYAAKAEAAYLDKLPAAVQRRAAMAKPERATAIRALAQGATPDEIIAFAREAAKDKDLAAAFGLRQAFAAVVDGFDPSQLEQFHTAVDGITTADADDALADLVGVRTMMINFEAEGPFLDQAPLLETPLTIARYADARAIVPISETSHRLLTQAEVDHLCIVAGVSETA